MKRKAIFAAGITMLTALTLMSCKKDECHECHYDIDGTTVPLGEKCGSELENLEKNGYASTEYNATFDVHCHEH